MWTRWLRWRPGKAQASEPHKTEVTTPTVKVEPANERGGAPTGRGGAASPTGRAGQEAGKGQASGGVAGSAPTTPRAPRSPLTPSGGRRSHPVFSEEALWRAWRAVRANGGAAGSDSLDLATFEARLDERLATLRVELMNGSYRPQRVICFSVRKASGGMRPLVLWAVRDRVAQRAVYDWLELQWEREFLDCSHGYRPGRSVDTAVASVVAARDEGLRWVMETDIRQCFDSIDPLLLTEMLRRRRLRDDVRWLLELWLTAPIIGADGARRPVGVAQGNVLSPLLCNLYLHPFDEIVTGQGRRLVRYADDLVILTRKRQEALAAQAETTAALAKLRLEVKPDKTAIRSFDEGFKFLGVFFIRNEHYKV